MATGSVAAADSAATAGGADMVAAGSTAGSAAGGAAAGNADVGLPLRLGAEDRLPEG